MQVSKWGNSLAIRLPASLVEALDLKPGDRIEIESPAVRSRGQSQEQRTRPSSSAEVAASFAPRIRL